MPRRRRRMAALAGGNGGSVPAAPANPAPDERQWTIAVLDPSSVRDGRVDQQDEVTKQFGGWKGLALYEQMLRQFPFLVGICRQWISAINAIDRAIKPGKPGDKRSEEMAEQTRYLYSRIEGKETINERLLWGRYFGFAAAELGPWVTDEATGLRAPSGVFDLDPWLFKFGPKGEPYILTAKSPYDGEPADPFNFLFFRWGSRYTAYGKGDLRYAYMPTWQIQQLQRLMLQAIERYGRPIPWYRYPNTWSEPQVANVKAALIAQFKYCVMTPVQNAADEALEFPALNVVASGAAGRAEMEALRHYIGQCYIALIGTQQTQDKTGGSRALEDTRREISMDQTPPGSQALDTVWTKQWSDRIWQVNDPTSDRALWPRFDSDVDAQSGAQGSLLAAAGDQIGKYRRGELAAVDLEELLVLGGMKRLKAKEITEDDTRVAALSAPPAIPAMPDMPEEPGEGSDDEAT